MFERLKFKNEFMNDLRIEIKMLNEQYLKVKLTVQKECNVAANKQNKLKKKKIEKAYRVHNIFIVNILFSVWEGNQDWSYQKSLQMQLETEKYQQYFTTRTYSDSLYVFTYFRVSVEPP